MSDGPAPAAPLFIVGAPRSGTSILYRTLLKHPAFRVDADPALALAESAVLESLPAAPRWRAPRPPRLWRFFLQDREGYDAFLAEVRGLTAGHGPVEDGSRPPWAGPVLESFVRHASAVRSCRRLLEKTPTHIERAEWLLEGLPGSMLLFIHRHPLDTYSSYLRRAREDPDAGWAALSVEEFASLYRRYAGAAAELERRHPDRFLVLSYEGFTRDPAPRIEEVCEWIGEAFHPTMVEEDSPDLARARHDPHLFGEITVRTKDWSEYLDPAQAAELEDLTLRSADPWGYRPRAPS